MAAAGHRPERTCIGCRAVAPAAEMVRLALDGDAVVVAPAGRSTGRGAWLHPRDECVRAALKRRAFARAFRRPVTVAAAPEDFMVALTARH
jgi:uncharacterized protein